MQRARVSRVQAGPGEDPQMFELPPWYVSRVSIKHTDAPWLWEMGIKWTGMPIDSGMQLALGGLTYTAVPYSSWCAPRDCTPGLHPGIARILSAFWLPASLCNVCAAHDIACCCARSPRAADVACASATAFLLATGRLAQRHL